MWTLGSEAPRPIVDEHIYGADSEGVLRCLRLGSGQQIWKNESAVPRNRWATIHMVRNADRTWLFNEISRAKLIAPHNRAIN